MWLAEVLAIPAETLEGRRLPVVVCSDGERSVGLVAEQILDVVEEVVKVRLPTARRAARPPVASTARSAWVG